MATELAATGSTEIDWLVTPRGRVVTPTSGLQRDLFDELSVVPRPRRSTLAVDKSELLDILGIDGGVLPVFRIRFHSTPALLGAVSVVVISSSGFCGDAPSSHGRIDEILKRNWAERGIEPAPSCDDATFLRRLTLDVAGRVPTPAEVDAFLRDGAKDKRQRAIDRLVDGPEFSLHFGAVLDEIVQGPYAGNDAFVDYLRRRLREDAGWDRLFREMMLGPWEDESRVANRFLDKRAKQTEVLTVDATRVFLGVDISCAQCHDHPLVADWSREHYFGMAAFFNRTTGGKGKVGEKSEGELTYVADGEERTAKMMFLTGDLVDEPAARDDAPRIGRRERFVETAINERTFLSRAIVNRVWAHLFGRGLVDPVDQMHSENPSSVPGLLDALAEEFVASEYDLRELVRTIVSSRVYALSSEWPDDDVPDAGAFAVARLRPLGRRELATSILLATGNAKLEPTDEVGRRLESYVGVDGLATIRQRLKLEEQAKSLLPFFDERTSKFQSSTGEALFVSNAEPAQVWLEPRDGNLVARLAELESTSDVVRTAVRHVLSRPATDDEVGGLSEWFEKPGAKRSRRCEQLVWALVSSAEFRFQH